jgi:glyoxylase-like metal-dependent hydrolase (beta-lactamase superfamily II)
VTGIRTSEPRPGLFRAEELDGQRLLAEHVVAGEDTVLVVDAGLPGTPALGLAELVAGLAATRERTVLLITHPDADHRGGAAALAEAVPGLEIWAHALDATQLRDPGRTLEERYRAFTASDGLGPPPEREAALRARLGPPVPVTRELSGGEELDLGGRRAVLRHAPGHSAGNMLAWLPEERVAIVGDAAMGVGVPLVSGGLMYAPMYTPPSAYRATLRQLGADAPSLLLAAHEAPLAGHEVGAFLEESAKAADRLERLVREALPGTLAVICERVGAAWGGLPANAAESLAMSVDGVLSELAAAGEVELVAHDPRQWRPA